MTDHTQVGHEPQKAEDVDGGAADHRNAGKKVDLTLKAKNQFLQHSLGEHLEGMDSSVDLEEDGSWTWKMREKVG